MMDKIVSIALSDAPQKTFQPLYKLPSYVNPQAKALYSDLQHDDIHIVCQSFPGLRSYSEHYHFDVKEPCWLSIRVLSPLTLFVAVPDRRITLYHPTFQATSLASGRYTAIHLPAGTYYSLLEPNLHELFYISMRYGLIQYYSTAYSYLQPLCPHWKQKPQQYCFADLGTIPACRPEILAAVFDQPAHFFQSITPPAL